MDYILIILTLRIILFNCPGNIFCLPFRRATIEGCSQSLESVKEGSSCPVNKSEWEARAQAMQCEMYSQDCTDKSSFVYHCLINPWFNGTIEVCAPRVKILGNRCAEFNVGGKLVQSNYNKTCQLCPFRYNSSESYKYQECYNLAKKAELTAIQTTSSKELTHNPVGGKPINVSYNRNHTQKPGSEFKEQNALIIAVSLALACVIIFVCAIAFFSKRKIRRCQRKETRDCTNSRENESEDSPLNETNEEKPSSSKATIEGGVIKNPLHLRTHFLKDICKVENCEGGIDILKEKIVQSPHFHTYNEYMSKASFQGRSVTGNWREDIGLKAAAVIFNMKIYVHQSNENKTTVFFPEDFQTAKWMSISVDKKGRYNHISDWTTLNEDEAKLMFDDIYEIPELLRKKSLIDCLFKDCIGVNNLM